MINTKIKATLTEKVKTSLKRRTINRKIRGVEGTSNA